MVKFWRKFDNRDIKIALVNSIFITKAINKLSFCVVLGIFCDVDIFKLTASAQSINWEVYGIVYCSLIPYSSRLLNGIFWGLA